MATVAATQAVLGSLATSPRILVQMPSGTKNDNYVVGGVAYAGKARWIQTNIADNDATQAAAILSGLA